MINQESDIEIDDREIILYASPKWESDNEIDEKIYKKPKLETAEEIENGLSFKKKKLIKTELNASKVDLKMSKESEIKKCKTFLGK